MMKMSGLVSSNRWVAFVSSVPGMVVSASSAPDCVCLAFASPVPGKIWVASSEERHDGEVVSSRRSLDDVGKGVDLEVGVDLSVAAWWRCLKMTLI